VWTLTARDPTCRCSRRARAHIHDKHTRSPATIPVPVEREKASERAQSWLSELFWLAGSKRNGGPSWAVVVVVGSVWALMTNPANH
jgi:hypothetical protein